MKNIIKYLTLVLMLIYGVSISEVNALTTTQNFPSIKLRHGYTYNFHDVVNAQKNYIFVSDYNGTTFSEKNGDLNGGANPTFAFTQNFLNRNKQVNPYTSEIAVRSTFGYSINYHPTVRKSNNLVISYKMQYYVWEGSKRSSVKTHIENQPYEVTWCGDGVKDDYTDKYSGDRIKETCDPNDSSHSGWGTGGCSNSCQPVVGQPVCNSLSYATTQNPITIGTDNTTKTVSCNATNATSIKIDCGNGITENFTGNNTGSKTVSKACTYTTAGTFIPKCYVNDTISNFSCEKSLTVLSPTPAIGITKEDFNPADRDTIIGNDTQTVNVGDDAIFKITVTNIGGEDLKDVVITDPVEPSCNRTAVQTQTLYSGNVFAQGDSFSYNCTKTNTQNNYTNTANVNGIGVISNGNVNDTDPTQVIVLNQIFDLALKKVVTSTGSYNVGDIVDYRIDVINQGGVTATGIVVTDYIPEYMELVDGNSWSVMGSDRKTTNTIANIAVGETKSLIIKLKVLTGATGTITNWSEISSDNGDDCDSTPNQDQTDDNYFIDDNVGNTCNDTNGDEDDHDPASITIVSTGLVCNAGVTGAQNSPISETTPNLCANTGETVIHFIPTIGGKTTSYNWDCTDGTEIYTGGNCNASYTPGGGHGGSDPLCYSISNSSNEYTCEVNRTTYTSGTVGISCNGDQTYEQVGTESNGILKEIDGKYIAKFTCTGTNPDGTTYTVSPKCNVQRGTVAANQVSGWGTTNKECIYNPASYCGDGVVQNPNSQGIKEQCDGGINCKSDCTLSKTHSNPNCSNSIKYYNEHPDECSTTTRPSGGEIWIYPIGDTLVGGNSVFDFQGDKNKVTNNGGAEGFVKIVNIGDEPYNLSGDKFCIYDKFDLKDKNDKLLKFNGLTSSKQLCEEHNIGWLYPGQTHYFRKDASIITGNPDGISTGKDNETTTLVGSFLGYETAYFAAKMNVTVAKPSISGQGGGTTYLKDSSKVSNINSIAKTVNTNNESGREVNTNQNNFVSTVLGDTNDLSNVNTIKNTELKDEAKDESSELEDNASEIVEDSTATRNNGDINDFGSYRGIENVLYVKDTNITLSAQNLSETKTYIIENGNLTIEGNIESNKNIAFIVKNGDIIIKDNVTRIDGTYVNINGKVKSETTSNKLTVNGSIYGDLSELTSNRTHMSMDDNGNISVGTIINYGSNILKKPAPLVGQFIKEYTTSIKIAQ